MQARFLLGPAGSGKTRRCLEKVRAALCHSPSGPPLVLLAPKQATFQLERQLLVDPALPGYTRLRILSFERLAEFVLETLREPVPPLLSEEGRIMVLRALITRHRDALRVFHASARLTGFAQQVSAVLRELQQHQLSPDSLEGLARKATTADRLGDKLGDLALLLRAYRDWLANRGVVDASHLLDAAAAALRRSTNASPGSPAFRLDGLWLDGFAEMTPQELELVTALTPLAAEATFAFCVPDSGVDGQRWLSPWSVVGRTFHLLEEWLRHTTGAEVVCETLRPAPGCGRFAASPVLEHLERAWASPEPYAGPAPPAGTMRLVACANPEAEAAFAAREVLRFVRDKGARFREVAVLVRSLDRWHDVLRRAFARYEIPCFLDRRQSVAHHPLAELTRHALRTIASDWQPRDWFGALKTGLVDRDEAGLDRLENEALARGWKGQQWLHPLPWRDADSAELRAWLEPLRERIVAPFVALGASLQARGWRPTGGQLADALRAFWEALQVERQLEEWSCAGAVPGAAEIAGAVHLTVWEEMNALLENQQRAFQHEALKVSDWLPILEAGLASLTVGVIPPALDQVLIGAIDRSRNPDLRFALVLGLNEGVFPARPAVTPLLTATDRECLERLGVSLGPDLHRQIGRERYYGYVACTRARERVILTFSGRDADDQPLSPSPFVAHVRRLFPALPVESPGRDAGWACAEHVSELITPLLGGQLGRFVESSPELTDWDRRLGILRGVGAEPSLSPALAEALYGPTLRTSVSRLEQFAACPFRFFVNSGLRAEERLRFEADARQRGSCQHGVLQRFHEELRAEGREWRALTPGEARARIGRIAAEATRDFEAGLFEADDRTLFTARSLTLALQRFVETIIVWMQQGYRFDPREAELAFGAGASLPAWELPLADGHQLAFRGKIDRVDIADRADGSRWVVVTDYKSSERKVEALLLAHGVQIQLPAYLAALRRIPEARALLQAAELVPAGMFYASLRGRYDRGESRAEVLTTVETGQGKAYQHRGRFRLDALDALDPNRTREQFSYRLKNNGEPYANATDPMPPAAFEAMLQAVEDQLCRMGVEIYTGNVRLDPYRRGARETACDRCQYQGICRIDPWTHPYRELK